MAVSTRAQDGRRLNEPVFSCNDIRSYLLNGRDTYLELRRNLFTAQGIYAGVLCSRCSAFIYGLSIIAQLQNSVWSPKIVSDFRSLVTELEPTLGKRRLTVFSTEFVSVGRLSL